MRGTPVVVAPQFMVRERENLRLQRHRFVQVC